MPRPTDDSGRLRVLVELRSPAGGSPVHALGLARDAELPGGFQLDEEFAPVPLGRPAPGQAITGRPETHLVRGTVADEAGLEELRKHPDVASAWLDTPIAPFATETAADPAVNPAEGPGSCPIPPCDCSPGTAHGTIADVAHYLEVDQIWAAGFRGTGMVIGIVDGGITAQGRPVKAGETPNRIPRVIDGFPSDWGTTAKAWGDHGNMTSTDALGMAPDAHIYDLRISDSPTVTGLISNAIQAFQWAIDRHRRDGTPHVLSNSWGIFQQSWDPAYATDPNHPFTQKVVEAVNEGILVLFAAGNCGDTCPDGRCGPDAGPGRDIWGANGHPLVMTVGAVNKDEQFVGYSSMGPGALDPHKPDFCSITHFRGYETSDSGTSAATPILAGAVALLKQARPTATQAQIKACLQSTAKDIGPAGWDQWSGAGIVRPHQALGCLSFHPPHTIAPPCHVTLTPVCGHITVHPTCPVHTVTPACHHTITPPCHVTLTPICSHITTTPQLCPVATASPPCPPPTLPPGCPPPQTLPPICAPVTLPPTCPPHTLPPQCPVLTQAPQCPPPTLPPQCPLPHTLPPQCPSATVIGPACQPHVTLAGCQLTLAGCPVATALPACPPITAGGCPQPSIACGPIPGPIPGQGFSAGEYWAG